MVQVYSLDGRVVQVMDRSKATPMKRADGNYNDPSAPIPTPDVQPDPTMIGSFQTVVRDVR